MHCNTRLILVPQSGLLYQMFRLLSKKAVHPVPCLQFAREGGGPGGPDAFCSLVAGPEGSSSLCSSQGMKRRTTDGSWLYHNDFQLKVH